MGNKYSTSEFIKNMYSLVMTKITMKQARFIRRPIYIRGKKSRTGCRNLTTGRFCRFDLEGDKQTLHIGDNCLSSIRTFQIERCDSLYSIEIGKRTCIQSEEEEEWNQLVKDGDLRIAKCPELSVIIIGDCSFGDYASSFILYSIHSYYYYQLYRLNKLINITY